MVISLYETDCFCLVLERHLPAHLIGFVEKIEVEADLCPGEGLVFVLQPKPIEQLIHVHYL